MAREIPKGRNVTYQYQRRRCGRKDCACCKRNRGHGPYWYAYWREGKSVRSAYIGKVLPAHARQTYQFARDT